MSKEIRIIKKYPNRRLYDTAISSYITLEDVKDLIINCVEFKVIDAKTQEDLTHPTLLQIIAEQEGSQTPILTNQFLQQLIRYYGNSMQGLMSHFLEQSTNTFLEQQNTFKDQFNQFMGGNPFNVINDITQRNWQAWEEMQKNFFGQLKNTPNQADSSTTHPMESPFAEKRK